MAITPALEDLLTTLDSAFRSADAELFLVGGALRDILLAQPVAELDFATDALPQRTVTILESVPNLTVYRLGEKFGTIVALRDKHRAEITTFRSEEQYEPGSRKPEVVFGNTIIEDLSRRDFTINSMAMRPVDFPADCNSHLIDPFEGKADLEHQLVRSVGNPRDRFQEDPLRLLRAVRFATALDFEIEEDTWAAMMIGAASIRDISRERIADELHKMLIGPKPARAMKLLRDSTLLSNAVPELDALDQMRDHGPSHPLSLWDHTMSVLAGVPPDPVTRWAALLHDIAKPETRSFDTSGRVRFSHHEERGAQIASGVLKSLHMSNAETEAVTTLVGTHMQVHAYDGSWSDGAVRRLQQKLGDNFERALDMARADSRGHGQTPWGVSKVDALEARAAQLHTRAPVLGSPLTGDELMSRYRKEPGLWIGKVKRALSDMVTDGDLLYDDKESAWRYADRIVAGFE